MAFVQKMKLNHELMEKRLQELRAKMEKEKEERRNQMNIRWKSLRPSPKLKTNLWPSEKAGIVPRVKHVKDEKPKLMSRCCQRGTSKQNETSRKSAETNYTDSSMELCCLGSSLQNKRSVTRIDDAKTCQSYAVAMQFPKKVNTTQQFGEKSGELRVEKECGKLLSGNYDEEGSSQYFQAAVIAWRDNVKKVESSEKGTNPLEQNCGKLDVEIVDYLEQLLKQNTVEIQLDDVIDFERADVFNSKRQCGVVDEDRENSKERDEIISVIEFDDLKEIAAETGRKKTHFREKTIVEITSCLKTKVESVEIESLPFDSSVEILQLELQPLDEQLENAMYEERGSKQVRPRLLVTPIFNEDAYNGQPSSPKRWSNSKLDAMNSSFNSNLRSPSPRFVNSKYRHVQSKIAQIWQSPSPTPLKRNIDKKVARKQLSVVMDRMDSVSDVVINETIGQYVQRLSPSEPSIMSPTEIFDTDITCENFGIKDFLTLDANLIEENGMLNLPSEDDIGKTLLTKPPEIIDCHIGEMIGTDVDPPLDDTRTPTPPPEADLDGFPDECLLLKERKYDEISGSTDSGDISINLGIETVDSPIESESKALEVLENEMATLPLDDSKGGDNSVDSQIFMELPLDDDDERRTAQSEREEEVKTVMSLK